MPILNRAIDGALNPYLTTSDDRLIEYGFVEMVFDQSSGKRILVSLKLRNWTILLPTAYQRVQIVSTVDHGNVLILDGAVNLAENDTEAYTHTLMNVQNVSKKKNQYKNGINSIFHLPITRLFVIAIRLLQ